MVRWMPPVDGSPRLVGTTEAVDIMDVDAAGRRMAYSPGGVFSGRKVYVRSLQEWATPPRLVADERAEIVDVAFRPDGLDVAAADKSGKIRIWAADGGSDRPRRVVDCPGVVDIAFSPRGRWLAAVGAGERMYARLWDLTAPPAAEPLRLLLVGIVAGGWAFDPTERWLATAPGLFGVDVWPLGESYPRSVGGHEWFVDNVAFTPDGATLLSVAGAADGTVRARSLSSDAPGDERILLRAGLSNPGMDVDPTATWVAVSTADGRVVAVPVAGGAPRRFDGFSSSTAGAISVAFSPDGRRLAAAPGRGTTEDKVVRVWDLESGAGHVPPPPRCGRGRGGRSEWPFVRGRRARRDEQPHERCPALRSAYGPAHRAVLPSGTRARRGQSGAHRVCRAQGSRRARPDRGARPRADEALLVSPMRFR